MESSLKPPVILLDEDETYLIAASKVLLDMGHEVHAMKSPIETINIIHSLNRSAIILLDYEMQDMDPRRFMRYINEISRFDLFAVLVTTNITSDKKRIMYEDALTDGVRMSFEKKHRISKTKSVYDLSTLYRRVIMTAEEVLVKLAASKKDPLTNLPNRLGGFEQWDAEWNRRLIRNKGPISFILLDFNGMKITNDTYGHAAGDILIRKFADKIQDELRLDDIIIRWGGDEFLIIMTNTNRQKATSAVKRLKQLFKGTRFEVADGVYIPTLFCAGIVTYTGRYVEDTAQSVFRENTDLADIALYEDKAKNPKRNKLILAGIKKSKESEKND